MKLIIATLLSPILAQNCLESPTDFLESRNLNSYELRENFTPGEVSCLMNGEQPASGWNHRDRCLVYCEDGFELVTTDPDWTRDFANLVCNNGNWKFMNDVALTEFSVD